MFKLLLISFLLLSFPLAGWSETKKTSPEEVSAAIPVSTESPKNDSVDEADQLITNRRLRADAGSLSLWSVSSSFNYQGGSLADPTDPKRPNIVRGADALTLQNLTGDVGVRYRMTKLLSVTGSTGVFMTTPFHSSIDTDDPKLKRNFDQNHQKITVNDPQAKLTYVNKITFFQSVTQARLTLITNNQQKLDGYRWSYYFSENLMHNVSGTRFSYGTNIAAQFYSFSRKNDALTDSVIGFYPALEYEFTDKLNFRTAFGTWVYQHIRSEETWTYEKRKVYQSVGLGITLTRDIFLYPNIQYIPSDIRADRTNIALSTNINFF